MIIVHIGVSLQGISIYRSQSKGIDQKVKFIFINILHTLESSLLLFAWSVIMYRDANITNAKRFTGKSS